jgi:uncharacterized small protein (TIGR04563 family)
MEQVNTNENTGTVKSEKDNRKQSLYFPGDMLAEMKEEAARLDRSLSWVVQRAWKLAKSDIRDIPSITDTEDDI